MKEMENKSYNYVHTYLNSVRTMIHVYRFIFSISSSFPFNTKFTIVFTDTHDWITVHINEFRS